MAGPWDSLGEGGRGSCKEGPHQFAKKVPPCVNTALVEPAAVGFEVSLWCGGTDLDPLH